jgi:5-methylcytosine-specific restriction endonuclease McrA
VNYLTDNCKCYRHIKGIADVLGRSPDAVWLKSKQLKLGCTKPYLETDRSRIPPELANDVYKKFSGRCDECGKDTSETIMEIHHIIPWSRVRTHELSNLRLLCYKCHRKIHHNSYVLVSGRKVSPLAK